MKAAYFYCPVLTRTDFFNEILFKTKNLIPVLNLFAWRIPAWGDLLLAKL